MEVGQAIMKPGEKTNFTAKNRNNKFITKVDFEDLGGPTIHTHDGKIGNIGFNILGFSASFFTGNILRTLFFLFSFIFKLYIIMIFLFIILL